MRPAPHGRDALDTRARYNLDISPPDIVLTDPSIRQLSSGPQSCLILLQACRAYGYEGGSALLGCPSGARLQCSE